MIAHLVDRPTNVSRKRELSGAGKPKRQFSCLARRELNARNKDPIRAGATGRPAITAPQIGSLIETPSPLIQHHGSVDLPLR